MTNSEKIKQLESEFRGVHYTEIPTSRLDEIDFYGYGWPIVDCDGDFIRVGGIEDYPELRGMAQVIVLDEAGTDWVLEYDADDEEPPIPDGMRLSEVQ